MRPSASPPAGQSTGRPANSANPSDSARTYRTPPTTSGVWATQASAAAPDGALHSSTAWPGKNGSAPAISSSAERPRPASTGPRSDQPATNRSTRRILPHVPGCAAAARRRSDLRSL